MFFVRGNCDFVLIWQRIKKQTIHRRAFPAMGWTFQRAMYPGGYGPERWELFTHICELNCGLSVVWLIREECVYHQAAGMHMLNSEAFFLFPFVVEQPVWTSKGTRADGAEVLCQASLIHAEMHTLKLVPFLVWTLLIPIADGEIKTKVHFGAFSRAKTAGLETKRSVGASPLPSAQFHL